jgi:hypothetical protein
MNRHRKFSDPQTQKAYDLYRHAPPAEGLFLGGMGAAYRLGLSRPDGPAKHVRGSLTYATWAAGVDTARA